MSMPLWLLCCAACSTVRIMALVWWGGEPPVPLMLSLAMADVVLMAFSSLLTPPSSDLHGEGAECPSDGDTERG